MAVSGCLPCPVETCHFDEESLVASLSKICSFLKHRWVVYRNAVSHIVEFGSNASEYVLGSDDSRTQL